MTDNSPKSANENSEEPYLSHLLSEGMKIIEDFGSSTSQMVQKQMIGNPVDPYWEDVTEKFKAEAKCLGVGRLFHDNLFSLVEAMSALELMDPKTDSGMVQENEGGSGVYSLDEALQRKLLKCKGFTSKEVIAVMDHICSREVSWLMGNTMVQTLFTCLYLHRPSVIGDDVLRVYCLAVLMSSELMRMIVMRADVADEEDFVTVTHGFGFGIEVDEREVVEMLESCEDNLAKIMKEVIKEEEKLGETSNSGSQESLYVREILKRIQLRKRILEMLIMIERPMCRGFESASSAIDMGLALVQEITSAYEEKNLHPENVDVLLGFEPNVNHRLLAPNPPRTVELIGCKEAYEHWGTFLRNIKFELQISQCFLLSDFIDFFQVHSARGAETFTRSRLHTHFWQSRKLLGKFSMHEVVKKDIIMTVCPPLSCCRECMRGVEIEEADILLNEVALEAAKAYLKWFQVCSCNRARKRRKLARYVQQLHMLQTAADNADRKLVACCSNNKVPLLDDFQHSLGLWALSFKTSCMIEFLQLGFELELYAMPEYQYIYSYLDYLFDWKITALSKCRRLRDVHRESLESLAVTTTAPRSKKGKKGHQAKPKKEFVPSTPSFEEQFCLIEQLMCRGLVNLIGALRCDGRLEYPKLRYDNEQVRYEHRFAPFLNIDSPNIVLYEEFLSKTDYSGISSESGEGISSQTLYSYAFESFDVCRNGLENLIKMLDLSPEATNSSLSPAWTACKWKTEHYRKLCTGMLMTAKMNVVVTRIVAGGHKRESKVRFSFKHCSSYPSVSLD
eukprot:Nk52_evm48s359 gene=Nk52_evmTU48s359